MNRKLLREKGLNGAPIGIRTPNLLIRSLLVAYILKRSHRISCLLAPSLLGRLNLLTWLHLALVLSVSCERTGSHPSACILATIEQRQPIVAIVAIVGIWGLGPGAWGLGGMDGTHRPAGPSSSSREGVE